MEIAGGLLIIYVGYCFGVIGGIWLLMHLPELVAVLFAAIGFLFGFLASPLRIVGAMASGKDPLKPAPRPGLFRDPIREVRAQWDRDSARLSGDLSRMALGVLGLKPGFTRQEFVAAYKAAMADAQRRNSKADQEAIEKAREVILSSGCFEKGAGA